MEFNDGQRCLQYVRETTSDVCDVVYDGLPEDFRNQTTGIPVADALFVDACSSAVQYDRTPRHIARGGIDNYQIAMYLDGETEFSAGRRSARLRPGDVCLIDMANANRTRMAAGKSGRAHVLSLVVPRARLAPLLATPDAVSASVVSRDTPAGRLIAEWLLQLRHAPAGDPPGDAVNAVAALVAGEVGRARQAEAAVIQATRDATLASIKRYIETNLNSDRVAVDALCCRFGISRTQLYRLFEADDGLVRYIQTRRLHRAFTQLLSPGGRKGRMIELAIDFRFSSDNTFIRAFRRQFGVTPGEVRELSSARAKAGNGRNGATPGPDPVAWLRSALSFFA